MLSLRTDTNGHRSVALRYLDGDSALLFGVTERNSLEVPIVEIETQWDGEALIVWETFEPLPTILHVGQSGQSVVWLQRALAELGLYAGATTGLFDDLTQESVRKLQVDTLLVPDGSVGPRTQMVLYSRLTRYRGPRLQRPGGAG
jgi:hypothetical protein